MQKTQGVKIGLEISPLSEKVEHAFAVARHGGREVFFNDGFTGCHNPLG